MPDSRTILAAVRGLLARSGGPAEALRRLLGVLRREGPGGVRRRIGQHAAGGLPSYRHDPSVGLDPGRAHIATTPHVEWIARMASRVLQDQGWRVTVAGDFRDAPGAGLHLVLCPQMFGALPPGAVLFQMEQSVSSRWFGADYLNRLRDAPAVLDYSLVNIAFLRERGVPPERLFHVPIGPDRSLAPAEPSRARSGILFYGDDGCPRRRRLLAAIGAALPGLDLRRDLFGAELDEALRGCAAVVNLHYYQGALLETPRIWQALSHGAPVVSEQAADQHEHGALEDLVAFVPEGDAEALIGALAPLLQPGTGAARAEQVRRGVERQPDRFAAALSAALCAAGFAPPRG